MEPVPEPTRAWLVRPERGSGGVEGTLTLDPGNGRLWFESRRGHGDVSFDLASIEKTKKVRGSPVLEVLLRVDGAKRVILFYFAQPPPLLRTAAVLSLRERKEMRETVAWIRDQNARLKDEVKAWARAIVEARRRVTS